MAKIVKFIYFFNFFFKFFLFPNEIIYKGELVSFTEPGKEQFGQQCTMPFLPTLKMLTTVPQPISRL